MKILLAISTPEVARLYATILQQTDNVVTMCLNGVSALEHCLQETYDCLFLHDALSSIPTNIIIQELRENEIHTPVLVLSALPTSQKRKHYLDCGATEVVLLNQSIESLTHTIQQYVPIGRAIDKTQQFLSEAAHQIQVPLQTAALEIDMILQGIRPCNLKSIKRLQSSLKHVQNFVPRLLKFLRWDQANTPITKSPCVISSLIRKALEVCKPRLRNCKFSTLLPDGNQKALLDRMEIIEAVVVLLENAAKYTPDGKRIQLRTKVTPDLLSITIANECHGIAPSELEKIFQPFYRSPAAIKQPGFGVGLALAQRIARMHGGHIKAHSDGRSYASFTITVPRFTTGTAAPTTLVPERMNHTNASSRDLAS